MTFSYTDLSIKQGLTSPDSDVDSLDEDEDKSTYKLEFQLYKRNYYQEKLHFAVSHHRPVDCVSFQLTGCCSGY